MGRLPGLFKTSGGEMTPFRIAALYAAVSGLWILFSDRLLAYLVSDNRLLTTLQTWKGLFFVVTTALLLAWLIRRYVRELREAEVTYRIVAENTHDWEFWVSPEGEFIYNSPSCLRVTGHRAEEFSADPGLLVRIIHPDDIPLFLAHRREVVSGCMSGDLEFRIVRPDGETRWIGHVCQPVFDDVGRFLGNRGSNRDITGQRQAQDALREQFSQLSTIFDSLNAVVYVADMEDYRLLYVNSFGSSLFGGDWHGKKCHEVLQVGQEGPCEFCTNDTLVKDGKPQPPYVWEFRNTRTGRWFQCIDRAIRWTDGRLVRIEIAVDITERKEIERIRDEMISALSHEMRTPLTAMIGFTELLLEQDVGEDARREYLGIMHKESERLNELIGTFLQLQRHASRSEHAILRSLPVRELLENTAAAYAGMSPRHRLVIDSPPGLPDIRGDGDQLHQLFCNLISNAIRYSPDGGVVTLAARQDGAEIVVSVHDEGIGIPADLQELIFEKFYRVDNTDTRRIGGTGLGLALVREIIKLNSGRVWVESKPGKGSTFFVALPCWEMEGTERANDAERP